MTTKITIPKTFQLMNRTWKVKHLTDKAEARLTKGTELEGQRLWGLCDTEHAIIWIRESSNKETMMHTFLHELGHAMFFALGWSGYFELEEPVVDGMGAAFHQFLKSKKGTFSI
jgi:hypothetical protein